VGGDRKSEINRTSEGPLISPDDVGGQGEKRDLGNHKVTIGPADFGLRYDQVHQIRRLREQRGWYILFAR